MAKKKSTKSTKKAKKKVKPKKEQVKRGKPKKAKTIKEKAKKKQRAAKPKARKAPARMGSQIHFICSECYEEFNLSAKNMKETLTCPECLHVGKKPQEDFLLKVKQTKGREKKILLMASLMAILAGVAGLGVITQLTAHADLIPLEGDMATYALGGGLAVFFLLSLILSIQYERNRWEVYF